MPAPERRLLCLLLLGLILAGPLSVAAYAAADTRAARFIEIANDALEQALALRALALTNGSDISAADVLIANGNTSLAAASAAFSAEPPDYETAAAAAREAAASFRAALRLLGEDIGDEVLTAAESGRGLLEAIANHRRRLNRLNESIGVVEVTTASPLPLETQEQLDKARDDLMTAEDEFASAEALLDASPPSVPLATAHITAGLRYLQAALTSIRRATDWTDAWKAQTNVLEPLLRQLQELQAGVDAAEAGGEDVDEVQEKLDQAWGLYSEAEALQPGGDKQVLLQLVNDIRKLLADIRNDLARL
jgi:hypothetical protein